MNVRGALIHLKDARNALCFPAWQGTDPENMVPVEDFTIAEELERIDSALGPKGQSMFFRLAVRVREAYVEIRAAQEALTTPQDKQGED